MCEQKRFVNRIIAKNIYIIQKIQRDMDLIPYVFEFARVRNNKENDKSFAMKYEDYTEYRIMFEDLSDQEKRVIYEKVMTKKKKRNANM